MPAWLDEHVVPLLGRQLAATGAPATIEREGETVLIHYPPLAQGTGYVRPAILLEFGARSTGEPVERKSIHCDAAPVLSDLSFPTATVRVMRPERTFWEKATAIHVFCLRGTFRGGNRYARHWSDLAALDVAGIAASALEDRRLARMVAAHKDFFFAENDTQGTRISYGRAVCGGLRLVPAGDALAALREDYGRMVDDGLFLDDAPSFDALMARCSSLEQRANDPSTAASRAPGG